MTATVTRTDTGRYRAWCVPCMDGLERASRSGLRGWADRHNRIHHPAPHEPDGNAPDTFVTVGDTPDWAVPADGSVTIQVRQSATSTRHIQLSLADAMDLQRHLNYYLKGKK